MSTMKKLIIVGNSPYAYVMKVFSTILIILLVGCLLQASKAHTSELSVSKDRGNVKPLDMICKTIGAIGFTRGDVSEEYRPTNFKSRSYMGIENNRELKMWKESPGSEDILKVLIFKPISGGNGMVFTCKDMFPDLPPKTDPVAMLGFGSKT